MTPIELHRLAAALTCLRPDWPAASLQTFLEKHFTHRPLRDIAPAAITVALDPATHTPARLLEPGPWWRTTNDHTPRPTGTCPTHGTPTWPIAGTPTCSACEADRKASIEPLPIRDRGGRPIPADTRRTVTATLHRQREDQPT